MLNKVTRLIKHPLFSSTAVMIVGSNIANFIAYIYHLVFGRLLGPANYGVLSAVISLITILSVCFSFLGIVITKFVSSAKDSEIGNLLSWFIKKAYVFGLLLSILVLVISPLLAKFLKIDINLVVLVVPIFFISFIVFVYRSFIQGLLRFWQLVIGNNLEVLTRLVVGVVLVYLGLSVFGVVAAFLIGTLLSLIYYKYYLRSYKAIHSQKRDHLTKQIIRYSVPVLLVSIASTSYYSTDLLLVKHFFSAHEAGIYASVATLGKIIFFGTGPVSAVMFPMISKRQANGQDYLKVFYLSLLLVTTMGIGIITLFTLFPYLAVNTLFGGKYVEAIPFLVPYAFFMVLYTLASLITTFYLSIGRTKIAILFVFFALFQAIGIILFHNTLFLVIKASWISAFLLLVSLLVYFGYDHLKTSKT